jgi:hypothetical protein
MISGMGRMASQAMSGATTKNAPPMSTTVVTHLEDLVRATVEEALELVHVVVQHRHQPTGGAILEVRLLEPCTCA